MSEREGGSGGGARRETEVERDKKKKVSTRLKKSDQLEFKPTVCTESARSNVSQNTANIKFALGVMITLQLLTMAGPIITHTVMHLLYLHQCDGQSVLAHSDS